MRRLAVALVFGASCLLCFEASGDTLFLPLTYADPGEICAMFTGKAGAHARLAMPPGVESIVALRGHSALVAQGSAASLAQLRGIVATLDRPVRQLRLEVRAVVPPAGQRDLAWFGGSTTRWVGGQRTYAKLLGTDPLATILEKLKLKGARILEPVGDGDRTVSNNRSTTLWFGKDFVWLREGKPLAVGLELTPRLNADNSMTIGFTWVRAALDEKGKPQVQTVPGAYSVQRLTIADGQSVLYGGPLPKGAAAGNEPVYLLLRAGPDWAQTPPP